MSTNRAWCSRRKPHHRDPRSSPAAHVSQPTLKPSSVPTHMAMASCAGAGWQQPESHPDLLVRSPRRRLEDHLGWWCCVVGGIGLNCTDISLLACISFHSTTTTKSSWAVELGSNRLEVSNSPGRWLCRKKKPPLETGIKNLMKSMDRNG